MLASGQLRYPVRIPAQLQNEELKVCLFCWEKENEREKNESIEKNKRLQSWFLRWVVGLRIIAWGFYQKKRGGSHRITIIEWSHLLTEKNEPRLEWIELRQFFLSLSLSLSLSHTLAVTNSFWKEQLWGRKMSRDFFSVSFNVAGKRHFLKQNDLVIFHSDLERRSWWASKRNILVMEFIFSECILINTSTCSSVAKYTDCIISVSDGWFSKYGGFVTRSTSKFFL